MLFFLTKSLRSDNILNSRSTKDMPRTAQQNAEIRDTAGEYLQQLTGGGTATVATVRRGRRRGRPPGSKNTAAGARTGRRKMSAAARKAISDAQKKRWAKQKKTKS